MPAFIDLTGQTFGRLTVLSRASSTRYGILWTCSCSCGRICEIRGGMLRSRRHPTKSCGCILHEMRKRGLRKPKANGALTLLFASYKSASKRRRIEFELTLSEFEYIVAQPCYYTGRVPSTAHKTFNGPLRKIVFNGIDRLDSTRGYVVGNCVPCCWEINRAKNNLDFESFIFLCNEVAEKHRRILA